MTATTNQIAHFEALPTTPAGIVALMKKVEADLAGPPATDPMAAALQTFTAKIAELESDMHEVPAIYCHPDDHAWAEAIHRLFEAPRVPLLIASTAIPRGKIIAAHYNRGTGIPVPAVILERAA